MTDTSNLEIELNEDLYNRLVAAAKNNNTTVNRLIEIIIIQHIQGKSVLHLDEDRSSGAV